MNSLDQLAFHPLAPEWEQPLATFFSALMRGEVTADFHPHPFDADEARRRAFYRGLDEYHIAVQSQLVVGYGMLRGWDASFEIPSLGVAVHPDWQGRGIGRKMMLHLHAVARRRGARHIRLRVAPDNDRALAMYRGLGYEFDGIERGQRVALLSL